MISNQLLKEIAEHIILRHTEDIEFTAIWEITEDRIENEDVALDMNDIEEAVRKVDKLISQAIVTVTFPED